MRRRRRARKVNESQNIIENLNENENSPNESPETDDTPEEFSCLDAGKWKDIDIKTIFKCEADFFCQVLRRLSKELHCARDLDDLDDVISLSAKFLEASAAKEQAIACQMAVSKGIPFPEKKQSNWLCDLESISPCLPKKKDKELGSKPA